MVNEFYVWGIAGMIGGLLWQSILPYLVARRKAEAAGEKPPTFAKEYATTALISAITGFIAVTMAADTFEKTISSAQSIMIAAGMGFSFVYTVLGIGNTIVDLRMEKTALQKKVGVLEMEKEKARITDDQDMANIANKITGGGS